MRHALTIAVAGTLLAIGAPAAAQDLGVGGRTSGGIVPDRATGELDDRPGAATQQAERPVAPRWSTLDRDGDNRITREEFDAGQLARPRAFTTLDSDGDGRLTLQEYIQGRQSLLEERFRAADLDGDGVLTENDFATRRAQVFDRLDANRDGVLGREELPQRRGR